MADLSNGDNTTQPVPPIVMAPPAPTIQPPDVGAFLRGLTTENPMFQTPSLPNQDVTNAIGNIPLLGGIANYVGNTYAHAPLGTAQGLNPDYNAILQLPTGPEKTAALRDFQQNQQYNAALGAVGALENVGKAGFLRSAEDLIAQRAASEAAAANPGAETNAALAQARGFTPQEGVTGVRAGETASTRAQLTGATTAPKPSLAETLAERQRQHLIDNGFTPQEAADFQKTMAPAAEARPQGVIRTSEGALASARNLTRALQTAAGQEGVPLSQHPLLADYGAKGLKGPAELKAHGGDIGTATRAVMAGDQRVMDLLGPDLTQQLIQNKIAQIVRQTGAPEDVVRIGLSEITRPADAAAADVVKAGAQRKSQDVIAGLAQTAQKAKAGADPVQTFGNAVDSVLSPTQMELPAAPAGAGGGGELPPLVAGTGHSPEFNSPQFVLKDIARKILGAIPDATQLARSTVPGLDFSAAGRQAFPLAFSHPVSYVKGVGRGVVDLFRGDASFDREQLALKTQVEQTGISVGNQPGQLFHSVRGTNIATNEERYAGLSVLTDAIPALKNIPVAGRVLSAVAKPYAELLGQFEKVYIGTLNAARTYSYLGSTEGLDWASRKLGGQGLAIADRQKIAEDINLITGRGFHFPKGDGSGVSNIQAVAKLANGLGFSPQNTVSRAKLIPQTIKSAASIAFDVGRGKTPSPSDIEMVRLGAGYAASVAAIWSIAAAKGLNIGWDPASVNFGKVDLGTTGPDTAKLTAAAELYGFSTQVYNGHVYLDPGQGVGQDIRLLTQIASNKVVTSKGQAYRPWDAPYGKNSVMDLLINFTENKLNPLVGQVVGTLSGHTQDLGDPTQNPVTSLLIPLWVQSTAQASGQTQPGGSLYLGSQSQLSPGEAEKNRLGVTVPAIPDLNLLSPDAQLGLQDAVRNAQKQQLDTLVSSPEYQALSEADKKTKYDQTSSDVATSARKAYALNLALNGDPKDQPVAARLAVNASPNNYDRGRTLQLLAGAGKLTPDVKQALDNARKQPDPKRPSYDLSVDETLRGTQLTDAWLRTPAFIGASPDVQSRVIRNAELLRKMYAQDKANGKDPAIDAHIDTFYYSDPDLSLYFTRSGSKKSDMVSDARKAIQNDPLFAHFASYANKLELDKAKK